MLPVSLRHDFRTHARAEIVEILWAVKELLTEPHARASSEGLCGGLCGNISE